MIKWIYKKVNGCMDFKGVFTKCLQCYRKLRRFRKKTPPKLQTIKAFFILAFYKSGFKGLFTKMPL
jgi:hypothetical protein